MPVSDWPEMPSGRPQDQQYDAVRAKQREARSLLTELHTATQSIGDALVRAGFPASAWRSRSAALIDLSDQLPDITLDALLTRIAEFAAGTGPTWLVGDGAALDDFEREVQVLTHTVRTLRTVAQRQRLKHSLDRGPHPLDRALGDAGVGVQVDRLARALRRLEEIAPQLAPVPPEPAPASFAPPIQPAPPVAAPDVWPQVAMPFPVVSPVGEEFPTEPEMKIAGRSALLANAQTSIAALGTRLDQLRQNNALIGKLWPRDRRIWMIGLIGALLVGTISGVLAFALHQPSTSPTGSATYQATTGAAATATATHKATPTATRSQIVPPVSATVTPTLGAGASRLAVSPASVTLTCTSPGIQLTLSDISDQPLTWTASATGTAVLSVTSGSLDAHGTSTITVHASAPQHGPGTIIFTSNGNTVTVTDKVSCH